MPVHKRLPSFSSIGTDSQIITPLSSEYRGVPLSSNRACQQFPGDAPASGRAPAAVSSKTSRCQLPTGQAPPNISGNERLKAVAVLADLALGDARVGAVEGSWLHPQRSDSATRPRSAPAGTTRICLASTPSLTGTSSQIRVRPTNHLRVNIHCPIALDNMDTTSVSELTSLDAAGVRTAECVMHRTRTSDTRVRIPSRNPFLVAQASRRPAQTDWL